MATTIPASGFELLERADALEALADGLATVDETGRGKLALVRGEAGIGKTALVESFCASVRSARLMRAACEPLHTPSPLGPFLEIADGVGGELARIASGGPQPYALTAELVRELLSGPTVVLIEDIHWADEATLDVLRLFARRLESVPAFVIATYRDDELTRSHPLRALLGEFGARALRVPVAALSPDAVAHLATESGVDAGALYRRTNGNPFFVTEAIAAGGEGVPETVRDAVLARAARLGEDARRLLDAVAVVPPHVERPLLDRLVPNADAALDECTAAGMLRAVDGRVGFRHELARLATEEAIPPGARRTLHRAVLAVLLEVRGGVDPARLAHHAEESGDTGSILRFAPVAAERAAAVGAHREAADQYARALRHAAGVEPRQRAEWLVQRALSCYVTDQSDETIESLRLAASIYHELGDEVSEGNARERLCAYLWCPGYVEESRAAGLQSVALLEPHGPSRQLGAAYDQMAFLAEQGSRPDEARLWRERLLETAIATGDVELEILSRSEGSEVAFAKALEHGLIGLAGSIQQEVAGAPLWARRYEAADRSLRAGLAFHSDHGLELFRHYILSWLALCALEQSRWDEAVDWADEVIRTPRASISPRILALTTIGLARARRGDPDPWSPLDEAYELATPSGEPRRMARPAAARAETAWLEGRDSQIAELTDETYALALPRRDGEIVGMLGVWRTRAGLPVELVDGADPHHALEIQGDYAAAAARWAETGCPYEAALALAATDDEGSQRDALDELHGLGAEGAVAALTARLRRTGVRGLPRGPRRTTRENPSNLTAREVEVLQLLKDGLRNSEIAERLVLSERTVHHHVSAILRKLEAGSRTEAVARANTLGM
ncbi:MAG TPA: LuxR C-terminal-related transcriptional regulator [Gaiellaceae bacterium]|nr:LuxR C-terminal-related transcriptional regulator [Gaiellaceae bacterium]